MKNILLDTNILHSGLWTANLQALNHLVEQGVIALHVPDMVKREKISKVSSQVEEELNKAISSIKSVKKKGLKNTGFLGTLRMAETTLRGLVDSAERVAMDDFDAWVEKTNTNVFELDPMKMPKVIDDYFSGEGAYSNKKERKDIPDSIIHHTALSIRDTVGQLTCIVGDTTLRKALESEDEIYVYESLDSFFELDEIKCHIQNFALKPHLMKNEFSDFVKNELKANHKLIDDIESEEVKNLNILSVPAFSPHVSGTQVDSLNDFQFIDVFDIGSDKFSAKLKFTADASLSYVSDYGTFLELDDNDERDVEMISMNRNGDCELSESVKATFYGEAIFWFEEPKTPSDIENIIRNSAQTVTKIMIDLEVHEVRLNELRPSY